VRARALAESVLTAQELFTRYLAGLEDMPTRQAGGLPNHASWILGHCAMTMHRASDMLLGRARDAPLPQSDFVVGDGTRGDVSRFDTESVCSGSTPVDDPALYPGLDRAREIFESACARFAEAIGRADDAALDRMVREGPNGFTGERLVTRIVFHNATHAGQLLDLRRALGLSRVVG